MRTPTTPESLVRGSPDLVSLPAVVTKVAEMLAADRYSAAEIGAAISQDPALTARLLKIVNSPYYGFSGRIDTVSRAVTLVGIDALYTLVLTSSVVHGFRNIPPSLANMNDFWQRSLYCGEIARALAREAQVLHAERLFIAGLLHRVGSLVFYSKLPEQSREVLLLAKGDDRLVPDLELEIIGCTYADVGAELAQSWKLPPALSEAIRWHRQPEQAESYRVEACLVHLADACKNVFLDGVAPEDALNGASEEALSGARLAENRILYLLSGLAEKLESTAGLFLSGQRAPS
jgi:HD-like signal output (HDOD) protein